MGVADRGKDSLSWIYAGMAVRVAEHQGLHVSVPDQEEGPLRDQIMWALFLCEKSVFCQILHLARPRLTLAYLPPPARRHVHRSVVRPPVGRHGACPDASPYDHQLPPYHLSMRSTPPPSPLLETLLRHQRPGQGYLPQGRPEDRRPRRSLRRPARHGPRLPHLYARTSAPLRNRSIKQSFDVSTNPFQYSVFPSAEHLHRSDDPLLLYVDEDGPAEWTTIAAAYRKAIRALVELSTSWQLASAALLSIDNLARSGLSEDEEPEQKTMLALTSPVVEEAKGQAGRPLPVSFELGFEASSA